MYNHIEEIIAGPARIRMDVVSDEPMGWVLDDTTFLDYRLGSATRSKNATTFRSDLTWDRRSTHKSLCFERDQLRLTGEWTESELQRIIIALLARRMEQQNVYLFHSSAVRYCGQSILFLAGERNKGKTPIQIEARRRGAAIIATETTVVDGATQSVIAGSRTIYLNERAKGTQGADEPPQSSFVDELCGGELPDLGVFYTKPTSIDRVILPDLGGGLTIWTSELKEFEKAHETFHSLSNCLGLSTLLAPRVPMPILDDDAMRARRAEFTQRFIQKPYYRVRGRTPQILMDEVEKILVKGQ